MSQTPTKPRLKLAVNGAAGRMGRRVMALAEADEALEICCAIERADHPLVSRPLGPVTCTDHLTRGADAVIDFSGPAGTEPILATAINDKTAMVIGTTALSKVTQAAIERAASEIPIVQAANFSVGVNVLLKLVAQAATALGDAYDIEIVEAHHRFKADAPSGTALALAVSICDATDRDLATAVKHGRQGADERQAGEIGMHALRLGDTVGEHAVHFGALGETVTLAHSAHTRDTFSAGALRAARWVAGRKPGLYTMADVLAGES